jgi:hypothetical protein
VRAVAVATFVPGFIVPTGLTIEHHLGWTWFVWGGVLVVLRALDETLDALARRRRG